MNSIVYFIICGWRCLVSPFRCLLSFSFSALCIFDIPIDNVPRFLSQCQIHNIESFVCRSDVSSRLIRSGLFAFVQFLWPYLSLICRCRALVPSLVPFLLVIRRNAFTVFVFSFHSLSHCFFAVSLMVLTRADFNGRWLYDRIRLTLFFPSFTEVAAVYSLDFIGMGSPLS